MDSFDHRDLENNLLQLRLQLMKHNVYSGLHNTVYYNDSVMYVP